MTANFEDGKDQGALRTIGEVGEALGLRAHVLRYWEDQFPMLKPLKRSGGRRYYRPEDIALLREIDRLVNRLGYTLRGARAALKDFAPEQSGDSEAQASLLPLTDVEARSPSREGTASAASTETIIKLREIRGLLASALID